MKTVLDILKSNKICHKKQIHVVSPQDSVLKAIQILAHYNIGALLVCKNKQLVGIFSERDYTRKLTLSQRQPETTSVGEVMSEDLIWVSLSNTSEECLEIMNEEGVRHLPVMDQDQLVGLISILEVANALITEKKSALGRLESFSAETWPF